jgi:hypothetical protein
MGPHHLLVAAIVGFVAAAGGVRMARNRGRAPSDKRLTVRGLNTAAGWVIAAGMLALWLVVLVTGGGNRLSSGQIVLPPLLVGVLVAAALRARTRK